MMKKIVLAFLALGLATLACSIFVGGPDYPATPIPVSTKAVQSLQTQVQQSVATGTATGTITLNITEEQLTSYLTYYLQSQPNPLVTDPQVQLRRRANDRVWKISTGHAHRQRQPHHDRQRGCERTAENPDHARGLWALPRPAGFERYRQCATGRSLHRFAGAAATGFRLETISIGNGVMTVTGRIK